MTDDDAVALEQEKILARKALVAAAQYAAAAMLAFDRTSPEQAGAVPRDAAFAVRVTDILSPRPRVALYVNIDGAEMEISHSDLQRMVAPPNARH